MEFHLFFAPCKFCVEKEEIGSKFCTNLFDKVTNLFDKVLFFC